MCCTTSPWEFVAGTNNVQCEWQKFVSVSKTTSGLCFSLREIWTDFLKFSLHGKFFLFLIFVMPYLFLSLLYSNHLYFRWSLSVFVLWTIFSWWGKSRWPHLWFTHVMDWNKILICFFYFKETKLVKHTCFTWILILFKECSDCFTHFLKNGTPCLKIGKFLQFSFSQLFIRCHKFREPFQRVDQSYL